MNDSKTIDADRRACGRDAVTNGTRVLPTSIDGRSAPARAFRDRIVKLEAEVREANRSAPTAMQRDMIKRLSFLILQAGQMERDWINGRPIDTATYCSVTSLATRLAQNLGLVGSRDRKRNANVTADNGDNGGQADLVEYLRSQGKTMQGAPLDDDALLDSAKDDAALSLADVDDDDDGLPDVSSRRRSVPDDGGAEVIRRPRRRLPRRSDA